MISAIVLPPSCSRKRESRYITELLGHSQVSFTMQTYAHVLPEVQRSVATKMDEILARQPRSYQTTFGSHQLGCKLLISIVRPDRFELPTFWFVASPLSLTP